ncbi:transporter [Stenotrophomonas maltophilia]|nr:transporter [Stenotrophomonas maltophilia]HEL4243134.1 transporter [Stenotrophomonas maltophilia]
MHTLMRITPLALAALAGTALAAAPTADDGADVQALANQLEQLKSNYAQEVRRLRELDMQVQAMQARLSGRTAAIGPGPAAGTGTGTGTGTAVEHGSTLQSGAAVPPGSEGYASTAAEAQQARQESRRSVDDVKQQQSALFSRRFTIENSLTYARYDRKQLTLNGFLALDAIFLGNIAIENVESDSLTYNLAARWGVSPNLTLNLDVPYLARRTVYQKGGAGGAAAAIAQEETNGNGLGDIGLSANYRLFGERGWRPETVLTAGVTAPTGRAPYGLDWKVIERDDDDYIRFAVPREQPTGNGVWQANVGLSMVKTADPAILFANLGYVHSFPRGFSDIDSNPDTVNPGDVKLGGSVYFGAGVAFAFNERTSLSLSFSDRISARASTRFQGGKWMKVIGSDANAASLNLGVTYALNQHTTLVTLLGIGLTPDAPDFTLAFKIPYML